MEGTVSIEYTEYAEQALRISNNKSVESDYVDYFIQRDKNKLRFLINKICKINSNKKINRNISFPYEENYKTFFENLINNNLLYEYVL